MTIGENLRKYRKMMGLTQAQAAEKAEIALSSYQRYERDERVPNIKTLQKLAFTFNVSPKMLSDVDVSPNVLIKNARLSRKMTEEKVAERAKIDPALYHQYETGEAELDDDTYYHIFYALGFSDDKIPLFQTITIESTNTIIEKINANLKILSPEACLKILDLSNDYKKIPDYKRKQTIHSVEQKRVDLSSIRDKEAPHENHEN